MYKRQRQGVYPYYGAQGIIDHIDGYLFDGRYILVAEDGENLNSRKLPLALFAKGKFWVNNHAHILRANAEVADDTFLLACLNHADIKPYVTGAAQPKLSQANLRLIKLPVPPLPVQHRIASILSAYDDLIGNNTRRIQILEQMAQALYREWFVNFRFPGHAKVKQVESPLGKIPQGWQLKPLGEIAAITMGLSPKGDTYNEWGDGTSLVNGPVEFSERFTKRTKWTSSPTKLCREGDLVVCVRGSTTGKYVKSDGVYCLGRGVCGLSSKHQCFVDQLFANELPTLLAMTGGSTFPSWTGPQLKSHRVLSPSRELMDCFEAIVQPMSAAVLQYSRQIQNLRRTRDLLLPKLISGALDVSKLEIETA